MPDDVAPPRAQSPDESERLLVRPVRRRSARPFVRLTWGRSDAHRWFTWLALFGLTATAAMAVFGLPPIDLHGPQHHLGIMSPTCGGTRAARLAAQGRFEEAWAYNPVGIAAVLGAAAVTARALLGVTTGRWINVGFSWTPRRTRVVLALVVALAIALEVRQQLRADLLMAGA